MKKKAPCVKVWKQAMVQEKILAKDIPDKGLLSKIYKEFYNLMRKQTQFKNGQKFWTSTSPKRYIDDK